MYKMSIAIEHIGVRSYRRFLLRIVLLNVGLVVLLITIVGCAPQVQISPIATPTASSVTNYPASPQDPSNIIQIGSLMISKGLIDILSPLLGVIIGGLVTYLATYALENQKWKQQKEDKLQEDVRDAVGIALEWLEPIQKSISRAESLTSAYLYRRITKEHFVRNWPDLLSELVDKDVPVHLRYRLSPEIYGRNFQIIDDLEDLKFYSLVSEPDDLEEFRAKFEGCAEKLAQLREKMRILEEELVSVHRKTYQ